MTAKVSTNNFFTNFKYRVKSEFRIMVILTILNFVAAPVNLVNYFIYENQVKNNPMQNIRFNEWYVIIGAVSTAFAVVSGILIAMNIFKYLYKKSVVDMTLSLPLTTKQRFFSDFLAGGFIYLVPFILTSILSIIINAVGMQLISPPNDTFYKMISKSLITLIVAGLLIMLMLYVLTILVLTCCGSMFEALAYTVIINGLIPGTIAVFGFIFLGNLYGINVESNIIPIIEKTSPVGGIIISLYSSINYNNAYIPLKLSWVIPFVIITALYLGLSYFLYTKRKAEQVSKPFVYKAFYYIMITSITFCIGTLFTLDGLTQNIIPLIIITSIIYLIFEVITNRGFKKFYKSVIRYVLTIACVVGISSVFSATGGLGAVVRVPDASSVKSVEMNYNGIYNQAGYYTDKQLPKYENTETIKAVVAMHQMVIERYNKEKEIKSNNDIDYASPVSETVSYITIKYNLKNGTSFLRQYDITFEELLKLKDIDTTNEYKDNFISNLKQDYYNRKYFPEIYIVNNLDSTNYELTLKDDMSTELFDALSKDIKALPSEEYFAPTKEMLCILNIASTRVPINENYFNTLMVFKKYNVKLPAKNYSDLISNNKLLVGNPNSTAKVVNNNTYYYSSSNIYSYNNSNYNVINENSPEIETVLKNLQKNYFTTEPCYSFIINGQNYIIPPQYNDYAEKVFNSGTQFNDEYYKD